VSDVLTVVVADDHVPARAGVRAALELGPFAVVAEAHDAASAVVAALEHRPDVCLLDIHMPGGGITAASRIAVELPETAVVMLTVSSEDADFFDALRAGARGYLLKDMDPARLPPALEGVLAGEAALPRALVARLADRFRGREVHRVQIASSRTAALSPREWEILDLLREGLTTRQIAERLFLSDVTVRSHISSALRKLGGPDGAAGVGLLEQPPGRHLRAVG
jgi:DNA-binding NarL/FixJ family response regulator